MAYLANNEELLQQAQLEKDGVNFEMNDDDSRPTVNISRISEVSRSKENSEPHSNQKYFKQNTSKNIRNDSESMTVKHTNSNNKIIPQDSYKVSSVGSKPEDEDEYLIGQKTESIEMNNRPNTASNNRLRQIEEPIKKKKESRLPLGCLLLLPAICLLHCVI
jgi:hypothetical protein